MWSNNVAELMMEEAIAGYGMIEITPNENVIAESWREYLISYTAPLPIAQGGSLRITLPHFFTSPQLDDPAIVGYVCLADGSAGECTLRINPIYSCTFMEDGHTGKFGKSIFLEFTHGLAQGETVAFYYGKKTQGNPGACTAYFSCGAYFVTAVDPFGDRRAPISGYFLLEQQSLIKIGGRKATQALLYIPSAASESGTGYIHLADSEGNIDLEFEGEISLFSRTPSVSIPASVRIGKNDKGKQSFPFTNQDRTAARIEVISSTTPGRSNPCARRGDGCSIFWGDYHGHTYASDGLGTPAESFEYATNVARLDWGCPNDHFNFTDRAWGIVKRDTDNASKPRHFVSFLGFEITGAPNLCDFCIITPDTGFDVSAFFACEKDTLYHAPVIPIEKMYQILREKNVILIPHFHLGHGKIWEHKAPAVMRLAEIYSCWGAHEYVGGAYPCFGLHTADNKNTIHDLLKNGYRCGFVAGSDTHNGQIGKTSWLRTMREYPGGLTAVLARELTRESVWEALQQRRTYATTGARIWLDFTIDGNPMGLEITMKKGARISLEIKVLGTVDEFVTEVVRGTEVWQSFAVATYPNPPVPGREGILETTTEDTLAQSGWYYLRVTQRDGHMAWSSPIWVDVV